MDALSFIKKHGKGTATQVAEAAGTNYVYFNQIAYGHRRPSVNLAYKLVAKSEELIVNKAERLDVLSLLRPNA